MSEECSKCGFSEDWCSCLRVSETEYNSINITDNCWFDFDVSRDQAKELLNQLQQLFSNKTQ